MQRQPDAASCMNNKLKQEFHSGACFFASFFCLIDQKKKKKKKKRRIFRDGSFWKWSGRGGCEIAYEILNAVPLVCARCVCTSNVNNRMAAWLW